MLMIRHPLNAEKFFSAVSLAIQINDSYWNAQNQSFFMVYTGCQNEFRKIPKLTFVKPTQNKNSNLFFVQKLKPVII